MTTLSYPLPAGRSFARRSVVPLVAATAGALLAVMAVVVAPGVLDMVTGPAQVQPLDVGETATRIGAGTFHALGVDGSGTRVAIIDSGVATVPALRGRVDRINGVNGDPLGHGTHLAGIVAGTAPGAMIVDLAAADADGAPSLALVIEALEQIASGEVSADIVLLAADLHPTTAERATVEALIDAIAADGIVVVAAAGNGGSDHVGLDWPASSPSVLAVGAVGAHGAGWEVPPWSAVGDHQRIPDLVAPGRSIESLLAPGSLADDDPTAVKAGEGLVRGSGTSQAAALTAGALALVRQAAPDRPIVELLDVVRMSASPVADVSRARQGAGVLDLDGAAQLLLEPDGWTGHSWTGHSWTGHSWTGHSWTGHSWTGHSWTGHSWTGHSWTGHSWTGHSHSWT